MEIYDKDQSIDGDLGFGIRILVDLWVKDQSIDRDQG